MKQRSFASLSFDAKKKPTRREKFLGEMDEVVPWADLLALIEPSYPTAGRRGRPPMPPSVMLRIHFMQQWYALSDPAMEDALYEIESMRRFAGLELNEDAIPDETTILKFRRFLEQHGLAAKMLAAVNGQAAKACCCVRERSWTPRSSRHRPRPRTRANSVTRRCARRRRASSGTSG
ncbi:ISMca7, transposase [Rhodanobacter fulvus Jip2]|uniref:ISMca7, transposase n=1 Tax=Rhodanobacter fulvus Jip2 TaxID=1163408 RepID=I4VKI5_9GAMM|nr:ISMca7, transposase [Rhodanobacter fulvus Jip2]